MVDYASFEIGVTVGYPYARCSLFWKCLLSPLYVYSGHDMIPNTRLYFEDLLFPKLEVISPAATFLQH